MEMKFPEVSLADDIFASGEGETCLTYCVLCTKARKYTVASYLVFFRAFGGHDLGSTVCVE